MKIYFFGVAAVLAIAAIGCGSGGSSTESGLTKAQFIKRGDAICHTARRRKTEALKAWTEAPANKGKTFEDWSTAELEHVYLTVALPPVKQASQELADLTPPTGDVKAEEIVKSLAATVGALEENPRAALKGAPYYHTDKLAQAYGFKACGFL
ncbi:MAG TPA: hypothetical protein VFS64_02035 [Solirubrobacterales bacterium]|nr:hypothetical protein [Solirubrobacterales bacterium]